MASFPIDQDWFVRKLTREGKSMRGLAKHLNQEPSTISRMFAGKRQMKLEEVEDIARFIDVPVDDVLTHSGISLERDRIPEVTNPPRALAMAERGEAGGDRANLFPVRVYYEDTDFSGNVYHAAYLKFFERGRTEFLRAAGVHHFELARDGIAFAVRTMTIDFVGAAHIDDQLEVQTQVQEMTGARLTLLQTIVCDGVKLTEARVVVVAIKIGGGVARMPKHLLARLTAGDASTQP